MVSIQSLERREMDEGPGDGRRGREREKEKRREREGGRESHLVSQ